MLKLIFRRSWYYYFILLIFSLFSFVNEKELCGFSVFWCNVHGVTTLHVIIQVTLRTRGFSYTVRRKALIAGATTWQTQASPNFQHTDHSGPNTALSDRFVLSHYQLWIGLIRIGLSDCLISCSFIHTYPSLIYLSILQEKLTESVFQGPKLRLTGRQCDQNLGVGDWNFRTGRHQATNLPFHKHLKFQGKRAFSKRKQKAPVDSCNKTKRRFYNRHIYLAPYCFSGFSQYGYRGRAIKKHEGLALVYWSSLPFRSVSSKNIYFNCTLSWV